MIEAVPENKLLVAFSKGFGLRKLFEKRITNLLSSFVPQEIALAQDDKKIAEDYFIERGFPTKTVALGNTRSAVKRSTDYFTHIVIFWDGDDLTELVFFAKLLNKNLRIVPVQLAKVRNKDKGERFDIYIGRGTPWGNPFPIGLGGVGDSREVVINKYQRYFNEDILSDPEKKKALLSLRGYRLACHCKPLACHGDIIADYLNSYEDE